MATDDGLTRRGFLGVAAMGAMAARGALRGASSATGEPGPASGATGEPSPAAGAASERSADAVVTGGRAADAAFRLGVASYSLRNFPRARMIEMVRSLGVEYVNLKSMHLPYELTPDELAAARREIEGAGLVIVGGGLVTFDRDTDDDVQRYFDYARGAGMPLIVATCAPATLPCLERFARRYDIAVAIHNHGPEDPHFPSPFDVLRAVRGLDRRVGLCMDVGHSVRAGADVVQAAADAGRRLLDMHVKDLRDLHDEKSQVAVGEGAIPIAALFRQLAADGYRGCVNLEYEVDPDDPIPGMQRSFAYMRGVLAGLSAARTPLRRPRPSPRG